MYLKYFIKYYVGKEKYRLLEKIIMNEYKSKLEMLIKKKKNLEIKWTQINNYSTDGENENDRECEPEDNYMPSPYQEEAEIESEIEEVNTKIEEIHYKQKKELYKQEYDEKIVNYYRGNILSDLMTTEDLFNRREIAKTLAHCIVDKTTQIPFNIGIFGQ